MFTKIVKNVNESMISRYIIDKTRFTKQEVAKETGLSFPTVGKIIDSFLQRQIVLDLGIDTSALGGRKPKLYCINKTFAYGITMFFDETTFYCEIINAIGNPIEKFTKKVNANGYLSTIKEIVSQKITENPKIISLAIGVHGGVAEGKILYIDGYDELVNCDLKQILEREYDLDVSVENNMRTVVYGMADRQEIMQEETVVCLQIAPNGPGCGILVNGKPLSGFAGLVGEVGYLPVYGTKNLQTVALSHFEHTDVLDYFARLVTSVCVFLNPRQITIYKNEYVDNAELLRSKCAEYLPDIAIPEIIFSSNYQTDFMFGLRKQVLNSFYPSYKIISNEQ